MTGTPASTAFLTEVASDLASTATSRMASTPLAIIEFICACCMATSPLALACSIVQSPHRSLISLSSRGLSRVSQRAVVESGRSTPIIGALPSAESLSPPVPQAVRATAVETAVRASTAFRMRAFM